jgi:phosphoglycerate dehydrogenase-like enzyme
MLGLDVGADIVAVVDCAPEEEPLLSRLRREAPTRVSFGPASAGEIVERAEGAEVLVALYTYTRVEASVLERLPGLRLVATRTAGYSHIDVEAAAARGIAVAVVPGATTASVAEFVFGAVIALQRRLFEARESTRAGSWEYRSFRGFELAGKTLGIVGLGRIGLRLAELGAAFGMDVLAWSRSGREVPGVVGAALEDVIRGADVVCVTVALTDETRGLLDDERLGLMKPTAILVNTARGGIVDEEALRHRLEAGQLGGAVLDVLEHEPPGEELVRLARAPNVLITPHIAWHTDEALARQFEETTDNVLEFLAGRPRNLVTGAALAV